MEFYGNMQNVKLIQKYFILNMFILIKFRIKKGKAKLWKN